MCVIPAAWRESQGQHVLIKKGDAARPAKQIRGAKARPPAASSIAHDSARGSHLEIWNLGLHYLPPVTLLAAVPAKPCSMLTWGRQFALKKPTIHGHRRSQRVEGRTTQSVAMAVAMGKARTATHALLYLPFMAHLPCRSSQPQGCGAGGPSLLCCQRTLLGRQPLPPL